MTTALIFACGCGYFRSGVWEDDARNWERAFRSIQPKDVVVLHSKYWRTPHWSYESGYMFEIQANATLGAQLFRENHLVRLERLAADTSWRRCFAECPAWFAPKPAESYEVWTSADDPQGNFRVLIDKTTGTIFISDFQV